AGRPRAARPAALVAAPPRRPSDAHAADRDDAGVGGDPSLTLAQASQPPLQQSVASSVGASLWPEVLRRSAPHCRVETLQQSVANPTVGVPRRLGGAASDRHEGAYEPAGGSRFSGRL